MPKVTVGTVPENLYGSRGIVKRVGAFLTPSGSERIEIPGVIAIRYSIAPDGTRVTSLDLVDVDYEIREDKA